MGMYCHKCAGGASSFQQIFAILSLPYRPFDMILTFIGLNNWRFKFKKSGLLPARKGINLKKVEGEAGERVFDHLEEGAPDFARFF